MCSVLLLSDKVFFLEQGRKKTNKRKIRCTNGNLMRKYYKGCVLEKVDLSHQLLHVNFISEIYMLCLKKHLGKESKNAMIITLKYLLKIVKHVVQEQKKS